MKMSAYLKTATHISIVFDNGKAGTMFNDDKMADALIDAVKQEDWQEAYDILFPAETIKSTVTELYDDKDSTVSVKDGIVYYNNEPLHTTLTDRMVEMVKAGFNIDPLKKFLTNLMDNPSYRAVNELYDFLEASNLPITDDGHFLAYKRIRETYTDMFTGKIDNSVGAVVEMPRNEVNEDKNQTCSSGLHFCAREYLQEFGAYSGTRVVVLKINPRDVVSIPADYNNSKGRCCKYVVYQELDTNDKEDYNLPKDNIEGAVASVSNKKTSSSDKHPKSVRQISVEDGAVIDVYHSIARASEATGVDRSGISKVCNGKRKTAGGYKWEWYHQSDMPIDVDDAGREFDDDDDDDDVGEY